MKRAKAPSTTPWLAIVSQLKTTAESERWRLAVLNHLPYWDAFTVTWQSVASALQPYGLQENCPVALTHFDDQLAWAWDVVDPIVDGVLYVIDQRLRHIPSGAIANIFETMQSAALVFPDGQINNRVLERIDAMEALTTLETFAQVDEARVRIKDARQALKTKAVQP
jgi:hypothetical protein